MDPLPVRVIRSRDTVDQLGPAWLILSVCVHMFDGAFRFPADMYIIRGNCGLTLY